MSMIVEIHVEEGHLNVVATGTFSLNEARRTFLQVLDAVSLHKTMKVLFDGRGISGKVDPMERFYYGEFVAQSFREAWERGVSPATQFAYVLAEPVLDPQRFGENVAVNRGMHVKAFDNPEEALQWLKILSANKPDAGDA